jgi:signal transduction histidine kinase
MIARLLGNVNPPTSDDVHLLLGLVGHDLRGPLNVVSLASEVLESQDPPPSPRVIARLRRSTARIDRLIAEITEFVRLRFAGGRSVHRAATDVSALLDRTATRIAAEYPDHPRIAVESDAGTAAIDPDQLERALSWILVRRVELGASPRLRAVIAGGAVEISARDGGPALDPAVFTEPDRKSIGLYLAAEIARAHGGDVECTSSDDETIVTLRLSGIN